MTFCGKLTVCGSNNRLCTPRLRQAASPLAASWRERGRQRSANLKHSKNARPVKHLEQEKYKISVVKFIFKTNQNENRNWRKFDCKLFATR